MSFIVQDTYEPDYMQRLLSMFMQVGRQNLVQQGLLDYFWFNHEGKPVTAERKEILDFLNNMPRLEKQLRTATNHAEEVLLIVEGIYKPLLGGEIAIYHEGKNDKYLRQVRICSIKISAVMAYIRSLKKVANITTYFTPNIAATSWLLKTLVESDQKSGSNLLQHYTRTRQIKWQSNPMVETIMGIKDKDGYIVGEKKATELVEKIGCLWDIIHLAPEAIAYECDGIGIQTAKRLINAMKGVSK